MKYVMMVLLSTFMLVGCFPETEKVHMHIDSRDSLAIFFPDHPELRDALSDDDLFLLYVRSVQYSLSNIKDSDVVEWVGPNEIIDGRLTLLTSLELDNIMCRTFSHQLRINKVQYFGRGEACYDKNHDTWNVKIPKK